jgi:hypothetical protein
MNDHIPPHDGKRPPSGDGFELELDETETDSELRVRRASGKATPQEELLDLTFTKPGQSLNASKSPYDRAVSTAQSRLAWRRMREDFKGLGGFTQAGTRIVLGIVVLLLAFWLVRAVWRGAVYAVNSSTAIAREVTGKLQPKVGVLQDSGQQLTEKMRELWKDFQAEGNELTEVPQPLKRVQARRVDGDEWPSREQDQLEASDFGEPNALIEELLVHKGIPLTSDGLGVFHVDKPMSPERPSWIGGFGLLKPRGSPVKALLHGTLVHHGEDGDVFVARYRQGSMQDFWIVKGPEEKRVVVYSKMRMRGGNAEPDGAAFVLDKNRTTALALVYEEGEPFGGQWCQKTRDENGKFVYQPPTDILSLSELRVSSPESQDYLQYLDEAYTQLPQLQRAGNGALQAYRRSTK